jgi:hypothetical protein
LICKPELIADRMESFSKLSAEIGHISDVLVV